MKKISLVLCLIFVATAAFALDVTNTAGSLSRAIGDDASELKTLTISGTVNAADFNFISTAMTDLESLDLRNCRIVAYKGEPINGATSFEDNTIPAAAFAASALNTFVFPKDGNIKVGDFAFAASKFTQVALPDNVVAVGTCAYASCPLLTKVSLNPSVTIGDYGFKSCPELVEVDLANNTDIGNYSFADCTKLSMISGLDQVAVIGTRAFDDCTALIDFTFSDKLRSIGAGAFAGSGIEVADMQQCANLKSLSPWTFAACTNLREVNLPASLNAIGEGAFFDCHSLKSIKLPETFTILAAYSFKDVPVEGMISLPEGLESIGEYALKGTQSEHITLPSTLSYIGTGAMENATKLANIEARDLKTVPELGSDVWAGVNQANVNLTIDKDYADDFRNAAQWQDFHINPISTNASAIDIAPQSIKARVDGEHLYIESTQKILHITVYDPLGLLVADSYPDAENFAVLLGTSSRLLVIVAVLADNTKATLKLAR